MRRAKVGVLLALLACAGIAPPPEQAGFRSALRQTLREPGTWIPAAGAVVFASTGWDGQLSRWAVTQTPVFGSRQDALSASDDLRTATHYAMLGSALLVSDPDHPWRRRLLAAAVEQGGLGATTLLTTATKSATHRPRPDGSDDESLPSAHASQAFSAATGAAWNLRHSSLPVGARRAGIALVETLAAGTGWARVEGGVHYPSDVLAGAALGHFVSSVLEHALLERTALGEHVAFELDPIGRSLVVRATF